MTLTIHDVEQGTEAWDDVRRGMMTASQIHNFITPRTLKVASNDTTRALTAHLAAERITGYTEPNYVSADMDRGHFDEPYARDLYSEHYAPAVEAGFMVLDIDGYQLGYSPDGVVGDDGLIEIKSRRAKKHLTTILNDEVPLENMAQLQAGLLVSGRQWIDYVSICGGMPLYVKRVLPDPDWQAIILEAVTAFETSAAQMLADYTTAVVGRPTTERVEPFPEMVI